MRAEPLSDTGGFAASKRDVILETYPAHSVIHSCPVPLLLQVSTQTSKSTLRFTGMGPNFDSSNASTVLTVVNSGTALNVTSQIYYNHPNTTLTHIHVA